MKTKLLSVLIIVVSACFILSCMNPDRYSYKIWEDKKLEEHFNFGSNSYSDYWVEVVDGDMKVFEYSHYESESMFIYGDEKSETVMFQINKDISNFLYKNEEIIPTKCHIRKATDIAKYYKVSDGFIEGTELNENEWHVTFDIFVIDEHGTEVRVTVDHVFST